MDDQKIQLIEQLKQSNNVLVTVSNNPTVDQLAACIGVTLLLNKLGKHGTAVFSGQIPSTLEFLQPDDTIEKNTDSLRDFIISLDKSKADKLRYKVEDTMVKIFITPYKTSISDKDLEFGQGDFNVDAVLAIGVHEREQLDQAIVAHGRILHDAVVMSVNNQAGSNIGTINWVDEEASSLSEMLATIIDDLQPQSLDAQMATCFLTGIVAETERFSNDKTSSVTMAMSSKLMAAGANQQLVATQLQPRPAEIEATVVEASTEEPKKEDGAIVIDHEDKPADVELPPVDPVDPNEINIDAEGTLKKATQLAEEQADQQAQVAEEAAQAQLPTVADLAGSTVSEPPAMGGTLTANVAPEPLDPATDPMTAPTDSGSTLTHADQPVASPTSSLADIMNPAAPSVAPVDDDQTLQHLEQVLGSPHVAGVDPEPVATQPATVGDNSQQPAQDPSVPAPDLGDAQAAVQDAINTATADGTAPQEPLEALNAQPVDLNMGHDESQIPQPSTGPFALNPSTGEPQFPPNVVPPAPNLPAETTASAVQDPTAPPAVPPPMMPPMMPPS